MLLAAMAFRLVPTPLSLYYFMAESSMSSLEDYVDDAKVRASEARILQALATDYSTDDIGEYAIGTSPRQIISQFILRGQILPV
jgi:hypothetical protein